MVGSIFEDNYVTTESRVIDVEIVVLKGLL